MGAARDAVWEIQHAVLVCLAWKGEGKDAFSLGMQLPLDRVWMQKLDGREP